MNNLPNSRLSWSDIDVDFDKTVRAARGNGPTPLDASPHGGSAPTAEGRVARAAAGPGHKRLSFLPSPGDTLFGFRLGREIGRGAFACVYLAEQSDLAGRPVVLKISATDGDEAKTLAHLRHISIVPIYSVHEDNVLGLRAVCMPYLGGATLSHVLNHIWTRDGLPTRGAQLVEVLQTVGLPSWLEEGVTPDFATELEPSPVAVLERLDYVRAAAWIVARLAEGLQHAHARGVVHRDVKSSNVLLGADGQPMLLDFNLAHSLNNVDAEARVTIGGTIAYMAPEQLRAIANREPTIVVDPRSDIYSLGIVMHEILAGVRPFEESGSYSPVMPQVLAMAMERSRGVPLLRAKRGDVPWSLESIFRKCLAPEPRRRYQKAEHLAEDLRRLLADRPLKYAPELSLVERGRKWVRRHPSLASSGSIALAAAILLGGAGAGTIAVHQHLTQARMDLETARAEERKREYEAGTVRALCLVNTTCELDRGLPFGQTACEETLALFGVLNLDEWQKEPNWQRLSVEDRKLLGEDTRELLLLLAWARVRGNPGNETTLNQALALLDRAEGIDGLKPSRALWDDRARYLRQLGRDQQAQQAEDAARTTQPVTARDHYLVATAFARDGRYDDAVRALNRAIELNPRHYWSFAQRGICQLEMKNHNLAVADFSTCIGLWPEFAWSYFNRGYVLEQTGNRREAIADYNTALERDPDFVLAYLNRGLAHLEMKNSSAALSDFDRAALLGRDDAFLHAGRGAALEGLQRPTEADDAFARAFERETGLKPEARDRLQVAYAFAVSARKPENARTAFAAVLTRSPAHPQALYGLAMLQVEAGRDSDAIATFTRALDVLPRFGDARRYRAILLARAGRFEQASQDINTCLANDGESGPTLYAAACVASLLAGKSSGTAADELVEQAMEFLQKALNCGYGRDKAATDPDLKQLRSNSRFAGLMDAPSAK